MPGDDRVSHSFWQREYAGRADIVGKTVSLDNRPFEILGVLGPGFTGIEVGSEKDLYIPACAEKIIRGEFSSLDKRGNWWLRVIARPRDGLQRRSPAQ